MKKVIAGGLMSLATMKGKKENKMSAYCEHGTRRSNPCPDCIREYGIVNHAPIMSEEILEDDLFLKYFVLKPEGDDIYALASRRAMREYARTIEKEAPRFAKELIAWANKCS